MTDEEYYEFIQPYEDAKQMLLTRLDVLITTCTVRHLQDRSTTSNAGLRRNRVLKKNCSRKKKEPTGDECEGLSSGYCRCQG